MAKTIDEIKNEVQRAFERPIDFAEAANFFTNQIYQNIASFHAVAALKRAQESVALAAQRDELESQKLALKTEVLELQKQRDGMGEMIATILESAQVDIKKQMEALRTERIAGIERQQAEAASKLKATQTSIQGAQSAFQEQESRNAEVLKQQQNAIMDNEAKIQSLKKRLAALGKSIGGLVDG